MIPILAVLLLLATSTATDTQNRGMLCVAASPECQATVGESATVASAEVERTYVWRRGEGTEIALGTVPANATTVTWLGRVVGITIRDRAQAARPGDIAMVAAGSAREWQFVLRGREAATLARLYLPDGDYTVTAAAAHRQTARVHITGNRRSYELNLLARPTIGGRVVDKRTRKGIVGAVVTALPAEIAVAMTDFSASSFSSRARNGPPRCASMRPDSGAKSSRRPSR